MAGRRSRSDAGRFAEELEGFLMNTPVWVGPLLAVAVFLVVRFVLAPILGQLGEPFGTVFGPFCYKFAPFFGFAPRTPSTGSGPRTACRVCTG
jgi:hypothetical protein